MKIYVNFDDFDSLQIFAAALAVFVRRFGKKACCPIKEFLTNSKLAKIFEILERHFAANLLGLAISVAGSTLNRET